MTIKNYMAPKGLATRIHNAAIEHLPQKLVKPSEDQGFDSQEVFYIKGPMGRGLQLADSGLHVAFCAGTGVLVFLDLVA